jgi:hypothetical protein
MNLRKHSLVASLLILAVLSAAHPQEKRIKREQLPPAVEKTVAQQSKGATIRGFTTEMEGGKRLYEVELTVSGHEKDISMDEQGIIIEVEEQLSLESLPGAVKDGLAKAAGSGTITRVESL